MCKKFAFIALMLFTLNSFGQSKKAINMMQVSYIPSIGDMSGNITGLKFVRSWHLANLLTAGVGISQDTYKNNGSSYINFTSITSDIRLYVTNTDHGFNIFAAPGYSVRILRNSVNGFNFNTGAGYKFDIKNFRLMGSVGYDYHSADQQFATSAIDIKGVSLSLGLVL